MSLMVIGVVVLNKSDAHNVDQVATFFRAAGVMVDDIDRDNGVVHVTGDCGLLRSLASHKMVEYLRESYSYFPS